MQFDQDAELDTSQVTDQRGIGGRAALGGGGLGIIGLIIYLVLSQIGGTPQLPAGSGFGDVNRGQQVGSQASAQKCRTGADANREADCRAVASSSATAPRHSGRGGTPPAWKPVIRRGATPSTPTTSAEPHIPRPPRLATVSAGLPHGRTPTRPTTEMMDMTTSALSRPRDNRRIAGVCAGLAQRWGMKPGTVRLLFVLSCLLPGPQFLIYIALWIILPSR